MTNQKLNSEPLTSCELAMMLDKLTVLHDSIPTYDMKDIGIAESADELRNMLRIAYREAKRLQEALDKLGTETVAPDPAHFEVGDTVEIVKQDGHEQNEKLIGETGEIVGTDNVGNYDWEIRVDDENYFCNSSELTLVAKGKA